MIIDVGLKNVLERMERREYYFGFRIDALCWTFLALFPQYDLLPCAYEELTEEEAKKWFYFLAGLNKKWTLKGEEHICFLDVLDAALESNGYRKLSEPEKDIIEMQMGEF